MKVEKGGDLIFWTYHMMKWDEVGQTRSERRCAQCGGPMLVVGPVTDAKGASYEGVVCHSCKRVVWAKTSG